MYHRSRSLSRLEREILDVIECEQRRLGRDLHDGLCQELAGLALLVHSMQHRLQEGGRLNGKEVAEIATLLRTAMSHARGVARGLDPVAAEPHGLSVALQQLATDTTAAARVTCTFHDAHPVEVSNPLTATHLYRIAQDAVLDAIRDGRASEISIELRRNPDGIELSIGDDGTDGISQPCALRMMKHRARVIAATLKVQKGSPGVPGARVICKLSEGKQPRTGGCCENDKGSRRQTRCEDGSAGQTPRVSRRRSRHRPPRSGGTDR